jgi:cell division protein FtsW
MMAFMDPDKYKTEAYQTVQGLIALGSGGVEGLGLGNGRQKMMYLPFAHTDFIFPVVGEELGLRVTLAVVFTYIVFIFCGAVIAMRARDRFGMLLGFGIVVIIALQAAVNIGVTTSLLPNKGLPLPFISYGGSNLVFCLLGVGILINIYRQGLNEQDDQKNSVIMRARTRNARRVVRL